VASICSIMTYSVIGMIGLFWPTGRETFANTRPERAPASMRKLASNRNSRHLANASKFDHTCRIIPCCRYHIVFNLYGSNTWQLAKEYWVTKGYSKLKGHLLVTIIVWKNAMSNNPFFNQNGKVFEINDACPLCWLFTGLLGIAIFLFMFFQSSPSWIVVLGSTVSCICIWLGWRKKDKNKKYIINSKENTFFIPYKDEPYCRLSEIDAVNKRQESTKQRQEFREYSNGRSRTKHRTITTYTYYVQIIGEGISRDFSFSSQGKRDELYSSLKVSIKDVRDFLGH